MSRAIGATQLIGLPVSFDRRRFVIGVGAGAAGLALGPVTPAVAAGGSRAAGALADWTIDDMWGVWPRPSEAIGFGCPSAQTAGPADPQLAGS